MTNFDRTALMPMDVAGRLDRLRSLLAEARCEALLVTSLVHVRYLSGFTGSAGVLLVGTDQGLLVTDGRYGEQAADQVDEAGVEVVIEVATDQRPVLTDATKHLSTLGLEAAHVTWAQQRTFEDEWFKGTELVPTSGLVERLRLVKDEGELARLAAAASVADDAFARVRGRLADELTEREFALELDTEMRRLGADGPSFETIVASGPNGARPHARPSGRVISQGDLVVIDFGALVDGYHSDMTRTIMVGEPSHTQQRMLDVVTEAQQAGVDAVRAGVAARVVDQACRHVIDQAGWGEAFLHGTGHGVGLEIHEGPRVGSTSDATLQAANVVTVEPGVYLPGHGGVRVEDTVVVTDDACRRLTHTPKHTTV
jgi:Xaa-Pro aminopeptidase